MKDYYSILGIDKNATEKEIKKAYRTLSKKYHPDISKEKGTEDKFKDIAEAYETLGNPEKKQQYDNGGSMFGSMFGGGFDNYSDIFNGGNDFFSSFFNTGRAGNTNTRRNRKGADTKIRLGVTLDQVETGHTKTIRYNRDVKCGSCNGVGGNKKDTCGSCQGRGRKVERFRTKLGYVQNEQICPNCGGSGKIIIDRCHVCSGTSYVSKKEEIQIQIPKGISQGMVFKYNGKGNEGDGGMGDLLVEFIIEEHPNFKRQNLNLITELKLPFNSLICGEKVEITALNGKKYNVDIPEKSQPGFNLRLKGKGLPKINTVDERGDIIIVLNLDYPKEINDEEMEIISKLNNMPNFTYKNNKK